MCKTIGCQNKPSRGNFCYACQKRRYRAANPELAAYQNLKDNAKRRKKEFNLSFDEFQRFAVESKYILKRGKKKDSFHIDRIDESRGYTIDNIQVLTNVENLRKFRTFNYRDQNGPHFTTKTAGRHIDGYCPF